MLYKTIIFASLCAFSSVFAQKFITEVEVARDTGVDTIHILPYVNPNLTAVLRDNVQIRPALTLTSLSWPQPYILAQPIDVLLTTHTGMLDIIAHVGEKKFTETFDTEKLQDLNNHNRLVISVGPERPKIKIVPI